MLHGQVQRQGPHQSWPMGYLKQPLHHTSHSLYGGSIQASYPPQLPFPCLVMEPIAMTGVVHSVRSRAQRHSQVLGYVFKPQQGSGVVSHVPYLQHLHQENLP